MLASIFVSADEYPVPTNTNVDFYGYGTFLQVGDVVTAFDSDGVLCGRCVVNHDGQYGFLHVYGDDKTSPDIDEGAVQGDWITIYVNGIQVSTLGPQEPVWTKDGDQIRVDVVN